MKGIITIFLFILGIQIVSAQKELQKGNAFYEQKKYDSASFYYRKGYQIATKNRDLNTQKKYILLIIQAELYAQTPDTALKYANLMYYADFPLYEVYATKESIFRRFLYYDSTALYAAKYTTSVPKTNNKTEIQRLRTAVIAYHDAFYYDLALFYCKTLLTLCETEYSKESTEYADVKLLIAAVMAKKGEIALAQSSIEQAMLIYQKYPEKPMLSAHAEYAKSIVLTQTGNYIKGLISIQKVISVYKKQLGEQHVSTAKAFLQLGILHEKMAKYDSALYYQQKALAIFKSLLPENDLYVAQTFQAIGTTYFSQKNYDKAEEYYQNALFIQQQQYVQYHPQIAETYKNLGAVMEAKKDVVLCYRFYELALNIHLRTLGEKHIEVAQSYINMGTAWFLKKEYKKSLEFYLKGLHNIERNPEFSNHEYLFQAYNKLSVFYQIQKDYEKAILYAQKAITIIKNKTGAFNTYLSEQYLRLVALYNLTNQYSNEIGAYQNAIDALCCKPVSEPYTTPVYKDVVFEEKVIPLLIQKATRIMEKNTCQPLQPITLWANENTKTIPHDSRQEYELNSALNALELVLELKHKLFKQGQYIVTPADIEQKMTFLCLQLYQISNEKHYAEKLLSYTELFSYQKHQYKFFFDTQKSLAKRSFSTHDTLMENKLKTQRQLSELKKQLLDACKNEYRTDTQWVKMLLNQYKMAQKSQDKVWQNMQKYLPHEYANYTIHSLNTTTAFETQTDKFITFLPLDMLSKTWKTVKNEQHALYKTQTLYYLPLPDSKSVAMIVDEDKMHCIPLETTAQTCKQITLLDSAMKVKNLTAAAQLTADLYPVLFEPLKNYLTAINLLVFTQGIFEKLCIENFMIDKKNGVIDKYKVFYAFSLIDLLNQAVEKPKTEFIHNVFDTKQPVTALNSPKYKFVPLSSNTIGNTDILHTDSFIDVKNPLIENSYLYISAFYNAFIPYTRSNFITFRYPVNVETEQQFWNIFYETIMKNNTVWNAFYTAQQKIQKQDNLSPACFRLYLSKI